MFRRNRRADAGQSRPGSGAERDDQDQLDELDERDERDLDDELLDPDDEYEEPGEEFEEPEDEPDELDDELADPDEEPAEPEDAPRGRGRRGRAAAREQGPTHDLGDPATWTRLRDSAAGPGGGQAPAGPWDASAGYPDGDRMSFGSLLVPMREGFDIQVNLDEEAGIWIAVVYGDSAIQLQAFAAPKTSGLWDDVRSEIAGEVATAGGQSEEAAGAFGPELVARLQPGPEAGRGAPPQTLRFLGADGPRWFLRGLITGPAALDPGLARPFEEIFADVVVVRGEQPEPPRKALDIELPEEARQAIEQQAEAEQDGANQGMPNPFERGPEITETR